MDVEPQVNSPALPEISAEMEPVLQLGDLTMTAEDVLPRLWRYGLMPHLIREMIIDRAIADISLSAAATTDVLETFYQKHQLQSEEQQVGFARQRGLTPEGLALLAQREQKLETFKQETWGAKLESYFLQRKNRLDRILYSLIRTQEAGLAQELYFRIHDDGAPFADLAREYSEGQEAQTGGLIGPVELSVPHPALARILSISQPGQLWPPTRVGEWYIIVRLEKFLPAKLDDLTRQRLLEELYSNWLREQMEVTMKALTPPLTPSLQSSGELDGAPEG